MVRKECHRVTTNDRVEERMARLLLEMNQFVAPKLAPPTPKAYHPGDNREIYLELFAQVWLSRLPCSRLGAPLEVDV